jgi:hypothetical protein
MRTEDKVTGAAEDPPPATRSAPDSLSLCHERAEETETP